MTYAIPISRVVFDGAPYGITIIGCDIDMSIGKHDSVSLRMQPVPNMSIANGAYKTLAFNWDSDSYGHFFGYVTDWSVGQREGGVGTVVTLTAMGPTFVMKTGRPRFFTNSTVADVIARLAADAQLGFIDEYGRDHYVWPQLAQTDESDWEFANDTVNREGSQLLCTDGVLRLIDPQNVLSRTEPVLLLTNDQASTALNNAGLLQFNATAYSNRIPSQYTPTVAFLNDGTAETVPGSSGSYSFQQYFSGSMPLRNKTEAELAQLKLPVDWDQKATARVSGSAKLVPGCVVVVKGGDKAAKNEPYDGYWYVTDAHHTLARMSYQTTLSLARIISGSRRLGIPAKNWWMDPRGRPTLVLNNVGNWISTWR